MHRFAIGRDAAIVASLGRAVVVVVNCVAPRELGPERRIQALVGGVTAGKQRVAAIGRNLHGIQQGRVMRDLRMQHVVMKHHLAIRQGADRLTVLADVRNHHDVGQEARIALWEELGRPGKLAELAEIAGDAQDSGSGAP